MKTVSLALIGDIHYPEFSSVISPIDLKDKGMSQKIIHSISPNKLKKVSDEVRRQLVENDSIRAVLLCGDLTSKGDIDGYKECLLYLQGVLNLQDKEFWRDRHLHIVPGNHDISRHAITPDDDIFKKFDEIKQAWLDINQAEMEPSIVRVSEIKDSNSMTRIFSVNSCVGCGEERYLPESIRSKLQQLLDEYSKDKGFNEAFSLVGEQLDTPVIDESHISIISESIRDLQKLSDVPVLLVHHGLLPQTTPRIQIYSELLNSGNVRFALASLDRPVIYCHGHLHNDLVEILTQPQHGSGKIIIISAPLFIDGFNLINLMFNDDGLALGCEVIPYRLENGCIVEKSPIRISLLTDSNAIADNSDLLEVLDATNGKNQRFSQILGSLSSDVIRVSDSLLELEWMGHLEIFNRRENPAHWQIRRVSP